MSLFSDIYQQSLAQNEKNLRFWEEYLQNLKSLNFDTFSEKLKVPVLVPIGSRILFRGELKHTNEVTVALGADYFAKCSLKQAEVLRQHRIKDAESKLEAFRKEREYLENQFSFRKQNIFDNTGQEILEVHTEEEDKNWREKHRENVRKWKQKKEEGEVRAELTDEELWERLEELELKEELENELGKDAQVNKASFVVKEETLFERSKESITEEQSEKEDKPEKEVKFTEESPAAKGKYELLQKVIDKQNELEEKLMELKNKDRSKSKTEQDLIAKLDEMDELEDLQDEMDRLEDIIDTEDRNLEESEEETSTSTSQTELKRRVSFADVDDAETLELTFHHTDIEPSTDPYDPSKGITKPSDIYEAYSFVFTQETTSILKKTPFVDKNTDIVLPKPEKFEKNKIVWPEEEVRTIVVKDVVDKVDVNENKLENTDKRPVSLFKQRRQQKK